jgi:hypothetical protein
VEGAGIQRQADVDELSGWQVQVHEILALLSASNRNGPHWLSGRKFDVWPLRAAGQRVEGDPQTEGAALRGGSSALALSALAQKRPIADIGGRLKSAKP